MSLIRFRDHDRLLHRLKELRRRIRHGMGNRFYDRFMYCLEGVAPHGLNRAIQARKDELVQTSRQMALFRRLVPPGSIVFDIGANVGNRIEAFLQCGAKVIAVEPQPDCVAQLNKRFGQRIISVKSAVGASPGKARMFIADKNFLSTLSAEFKESQRFSQDTWSGETEVEIITLDSLVAAHGRPVFIKIDVEGFEYEVLRGLTQPVNALSFEWTPELCENATHCIEYLAALGMPHFQFSFGETMLFWHRRSLDTNGAKELVQRLSEANTLWGDIYASRQPLLRELPVDQPFMDIY